MDLVGFKARTIKEQLKIDESFGRIFSFVDFGNVNYWFEKDQRDADGNNLGPDQKLVINLKGLADFSGAFSTKTKFYYGHDPKNKKSMGFLFIAKNFFGNDVITKPIQKIKHHLSDAELQNNTRSLNYDLEGTYVYIPKCNFDVEMCIDAIRLIDKYDTFCLYSADADFVSLCRFLKDKKKKIILIRGGFIQKELKDLADLEIKAQDIKKYITNITQKSSR